MWLFSCDKFVVDFKLVQKDLNKKNEEYKIEDQLIHKKTENNI